MALNVDDANKSISFTYPDPPIEGTDTHTVTVTKLQKGVTKVQLVSGFTGGEGKFSIELAMLDEIHTVAHAADEL